MKKKKLTLKKKSIVALSNENMEQIKGGNKNTWDDCIRTADQTSCDPRYLCSPSGCACY